MSFTMWHVEIFGQIKMDGWMDGKVSYQVFAVSISNRAIKASIFGKSFF